MTDGNDTDDQQLSHVPMEPEVLKSKGNEAGPYLVFDVGYEKQLLFAKL
jgi:hypothetical protein